VIPDPLDTSGVSTKASPRSVDETVTLLESLIDQKKLTLFAVIDHGGQARQVGLTMPNTKLVIFGSPDAGTPVMLAAPLAALDLPLKILVWEDAAGSVFVSYNTAAYIADRHHLPGELRERLDPIEAIAAALTSTDA
jgi:uncharacterized protein (DUF302 family)